MVHLQFASGTKIEYLSVRHKSVLGDRPSNSQNPDWRGLLCAMMLGFAAMQLYEVI